MFWEHSNNNFNKYLMNNNLPH